ncbi:MAG: Holliday junction resolvase RuvX [Dehalococcoidia bacterium]|nr:Holliday junction resolvase RuvX [Dehalococcoidia bacterium]
MRIMALDVGDRRIGVALSDPTGLLARELVIITRTDDSRDIKEVLSLVREHTPGKLIAGLPLLLNGDEGQQAQKVQAFCALLRPALPIPLEMVDEQFSTVTAREYMRRNARKKKSGARQHDDAMAAAVILQNYLDEN